MPKTTQLTSEEFVRILTAVKIAENTAKENYYESEDTYYANKAATYSTIYQKLCDGWRFEVTSWKPKKSEKSI